MAINLDAKNDVYNFKESDAIFGNVLDNDAVGMDVKLYLRAFDGEKVLAKVKDYVTDIAGTYGTFHVKADGNFTYTLSDAAKKGLFAGTTLTESLGYKISNGSGGTDVAYLKLNIAGETVKPIVVDDNFTQTEGVGKVHDALANDIAGETGQLFLRSANGTSIGAKQGLDQVTDVPGQFGTFHFSPDGKFTYDLDPLIAKTLNAGQSVTEKLEYYKVSDGAGHTDVGTITLTVDGVTDVQPKTTVVLDFEDVTTGPWADVGDNYHGFKFDTPQRDEDDFTVLNINSYGYPVAGINQPDGNYYADDNYNTGSISISRSDGSDFDFNGGYFGTLDRQVTTAHFTGYRDGQIVYNFEEQIGTGAKTVFNMLDVDSVVITGGSAVGASYMAMDNLSFSYDLIA